MGSCLYIIILFLYNNNSFLALHVKKFFFFLVFFSSFHVCSDSQHPHLPADSLDYITTLSSHSLWLPLLILTTYLRLCSSFIPLMSIAFPLLFWSILWHSLLKPINNSFLLSVLCFAGSLLFIPAGIALAQVLHDLFVPIMGRSGSEVAPDIVVGVMSSMLVCLLGLNMVIKLRMMNINRVNYNYRVFILHFVIFLMKVMR